jgi:hypothetical protein
MRASIAAGAIVAATFALAATGCGGADDDASSKQPKQAAAQHYELRPDASDPLPEASDLRWIKETLGDVQADFGGDMPGSICPELTAAGEREIESGPGGGRRNCSGTILELQRRMKQRGREPRYSKVLSIRVTGRFATALVVDPNEPDKPPYRVPFVKDEFGWALPSLTYAEPIADLLLKP